MSLYLCETCNHASHRLSYFVLLLILSVHIDVGTAVMEVGKLSQMGRFQPAIDLIKDTWKDTDDSWIYVLDRDADGNENVFQDFTAAGTEIEI